MKRTEKILRWFLLLPVYGAVISFLYYFFKGHKNGFLNKKKITIYMAICVLLFLIGVVVLALFFRFLNMFIDINVFMQTWGVYIIIFFAGYFTNIPIPDFIKKEIRPYLA